MVLPILLVMIKQAIGSASLYSQAIEAAKAVQIEQTCLDFEDVMERFRPTPYWECWDLSLARQLD